MIIYFVIAALIVAGDQLFKYFITLRLALGGQIQLVPGVVHLIYVENTGAAFSILPGMRWVLIGLPVVAILLLIFVLIKFKMNALGRFALAAVLGGAAGNLIDRIALGHVVDMFELEFMQFAIFNIADCFITVGAVLFLIYIIFFLPRRSRQMATAPDAGRGKHLRSAPGPSAPPPSYDEQEPEDIKLTETNILEEYDLERWLSEYSDDDADS